MALRWIATLSDEKAMESPHSNGTQQQLAAPEHLSKPKMLVVDDESDNLDLLYRTFRREYQVLRAEGGYQALQMLASEGEVAVIISDQRMPEMKGTEFLSKTVLPFPDTVRIILTGFTDVEDLVEAINDGQVYRYLTKPWDPDELKAVVQRAVETYSLLKQRSEALRQAQVQTQLVGTIARISQQARSQSEMLEAIATVFQQSYSADRCSLQLIQPAASSSTTGQSCDQTADAGALGPFYEALVQRAIATQLPQSAVELPESIAGLLADPAGLQAHHVVPILVQERVQALLSLSWQQPDRLHSDLLATLPLAVQPIALALLCAAFRQSQIEAA